MGVQMVPKPAGTSGKLQFSKMVLLLDITLIAPNLTALCELERCGAPCH